MPRPGFYCGHCSAQRSYRAQTIARGGVLHSGESRQAKMHTGNQPPFAGGLAQQDLPGTPGLFRIDVEGDRGFWPRRLNGREMDDIPQISSEVSPASRRYPVCPGRMAGQRARADPGDHLLIINPADLRRAVRQYTANKQHVRRPRSLALSNVDVASQ